MIATVTLNPALDRRYCVRHLEAREDMRAVSFEETPGGKGFNVAKAFACLGGQAAAYLLLGGRPGAEFLDLARKTGKGLRLRDVPVHEDTRTNITVTSILDGRQMRVLEPGPRVTVAERARFESLLLAGTKKCSAVVLAGSLPQGIPQAYYTALIRKVQARGLPCALDTDGEALQKGLAAKPFLIKPNRHEFERLTGHAVKNIRLAARAASRIAEKGVANVIVSLAGDGAIFAAPGTAPLLAEPPPVKVRQTVGGGDALVAGFMFAWERRMSRQDCARIALASAARSVAAMRITGSDDPAFWRLARRVRIRFAV